MQKPTSLEFTAAITDKMIGQFRIIMLSFITGIAGFAGMIFYIHSMRIVPSEPSSGIDYVVLTAVTGAVSAVFIPLSVVVPGRFLSSTSRIVGGSLSMEAAFARIRTSCIISAAVLEVPSLFGLCVIAIGVMRGDFQAYSWHWINAVPALVMVLSVLGRIPTREKLRHWYEMIS